MEGSPGYRSMESMLPEKTAQFLARLQIGANQDGRIGSTLETDPQVLRFGEQLAEHKRAITVTNTADCIDDRRTLRLANGMVNPALLRSRITHQLPGGLGLAVTKAAVAADAEYLRHTPNFQQAYEATIKLLGNLKNKHGLNYEDGGHEGCAASEKVEESVATAPPREILLPTVGAIIDVSGDNERLFDQIQTSKQRRLAAGYYGSWSAGWHQNFLVDHVPQNFSYLATQPDAVHGHYANGLFVVTEDEQGFAKNEFIETTGEHAFGLTLPIAFEIAEKIGGAPEERQRIKIAFVDDPVIVANKLLAPGFPAYADAA